MQTAETLPQVVAVVAQLCWHVFLLGRPELTASKEGCLVRKQAQPRGFSCVWVLKAEVGRNLVFGG